VDNDANFRPTKTHLNSLLFIFPPACALENVSTFFKKYCNIFNENVEPTFFNQHFSEKSYINIFERKR
jgi:hypothetical protein